MNVTVHRSKKFTEFVATSGDQYVFFDASSEGDLRDMDADEKSLMKTEMGIQGGVENLPQLFTATFAAMLATVPLFGWASSRFSRSG